MALEPTYGVAPWIAELNCSEIEWCPAECDPEDEDCPPDGCVDPALADQAIAVATEILWSLSGRRFGYRTLVVRPCQEPCRSLEFVSGDPIATFTYLGSAVGCGCSTGGQCSRPHGIELGPYPVNAVLGVTIDGDTLDASRYRLDDHRRLVRIDGEDWPTTNDFVSPATEAGVFEVTVRVGSPVPYAGQMGCEELACELVRAHLGLDCNLPQRVQSVSRQGISMTLLDPQRFLDEGRTGLYLVDLFLRTVNPNQLRRRPRIVRADAPYRGTVRRA